MDRKTLVDLEAHSHAAASNLEHGDFEQAMKAIGPSDHNRFPVFLYSTNIVELPTS
jgi:hypothetical protein